MQKFVLSLALVAVDVAWSLTLNKRGSRDDCVQTVSGCDSNLEIMETGQCVMADTLPQYQIGNNIDETISNFQSMLTKYYGDISVLENMMNLSEGGQSVLAAKMHKAITQDKKFVVGAIGSSVTAAHDNCHIDGYPTQLEILLKPLFDHVGVKFESRNGGIGGSCGDSFFDQVPCLAQVVGDDIDVATFSWDYWADNPQFQENFIRTALQMPKNPMPLLITLGNKHYPSHGVFSELYGNLGYHALAATSTTPSGVPSRDADSHSKFGFIGDGWHKVSRLGEKFPEGHCRRKSASVLWRNWHGGPMLYQLISDAMGWTYIKALKQALDKPSVASPPELPEGRYSNMVGQPRCVSFNQPNIETFKGVPFVKLIEEMSGHVSVERKAARRDMLPDSERNEQRCEHLDVCGVARSTHITFDLQARHKEPLTQGTLVVCIGGGPPPKESQASSLIAAKNLSSSVMQSEWSLSFEATLALPPAPVFPRCTAGSLESIEVDGRVLDLSSVGKWAEGAEGATKCGSFALADKNARLVSVRSPTCGVTHVFAM